MACPGKSAPAGAQALFLCNEVIYTGGMATLTFDTLKFANRLKSAGYSSEQAEAQAEALSELIEVNLRDLATKDDLDRTRGDLHRDIIELEQRLIIKLGGLMVVTIGAAATILKLLQ